MRKFKLEETQILLIGKWWGACQRQIRPALVEKRFDIARLSRGWACNPATSLFLPIPRHSIERAHVIFLQVKANVVFGSVLWEA